MNRFLALLIFIVLVVAGWSGAWIFISSQITQRAEAFFLATSNQAQQINCSELDVAGFPFRFDVTCTDLTLSQDDLNISVPEIKATVLVYKPTHALFFANGPVQIIDAFTGSSRQVNWDSLSASIRTNGWSLARISLEGKNIQVNDTIFGNTLIAEIGGFEAHMIEAANLRDDVMQTTMYDVFARLAGANAPEFTINNASVELQALLMHFPNDIRKWSLQTISQNWFEEGTGLAVDKFDGQDEQSSFAISGKLAATAQSMLTGGFDFFSTNLSQRFANVLGDFERDTVFGLLDEDGSHYQSYTFLHGIMMAGNTPILSTRPLR